MGTYLEIAYHGKKDRNYKTLPYGNSVLLTIKVLVLNPYCANQIYI